MEYYQHTNLKGGPAAVQTVGKSVLIQKFEHPIKCIMGWNAVRQTQKGSQEGLFLPTVEGDFLIIISATNDS
ncbi:MAG: hypothetical protein BGO59_20835 [Spirosoma sp. 48-14]|nr:MAG: hypothetical protein BGO59_20835 [Spirosoma sp. 48-14]